MQQRLRDAQRTAAPRTVEADAAAASPDPKGPPRARADAAQWLLFVAFTAICLIAAYMSLTGRQQIPLP